MIPAVRQQRIVSALRERDGQTVGELAVALDVSPSTVRRDLTLMEDAGVLHRTFGGAVIATESDEAIGRVRLANADEKRSIAIAATGLVSDGMTVIVDIGTSALAVAQELANTRLTVVTASLPVFHLFAADPGVRLILLGGGYRRDYECTAGHMTLAALADIHADIAFIGCSGVSFDGTLRDTTADQVQIKRALLASADSSVALADSSKFPGKGTYSIGGDRTLSKLITDMVLPGPLAKAFAAQGTDVICV